MRPASTLRGSPSLAPVTAPRHACPRCHGPPSPARGAHLPTVRLGRLQPAGAHLQDLQGATDGRPAAVLFDRLRHRRRCVRCGIPADATYCPRHQSAVRSAGIDWRARRGAAGASRCHVSDTGIPSAGPALPRASTSQANRILAPTHAGRRGPRHDGRTDTLAGPEHRGAAGSGASSAWEASRAALAHWTTWCG